MTLAAGLPNFVTPGNASEIMSNLELAAASVKARKEGKTYYHRLRTLVSEDPTYLLKRSVDYAGKSIVPYDWQDRFLRSPQGKKVIVGARKGSGKSTAIGCRVANVVITVEPKAYARITAPSLRQAKALYNGVIDFMRTVDLVGGSGSFFDDRDVGVTEAHARNGAKIEALPGNPSTLRGPLAHVFAIDEAAFFLRDEEIMAAVRPQATYTGGDFIIGSTPWGKRGFFYELSETDRGRSWDRYKVPATDCPALVARLGDDGVETFLEQEKRELGLMYGPEYMCEFLDAVGSLLTLEQINLAFEEGKDVPTMLEEIRRSMRESVSRLASEATPQPAAPGPNGNGQQPHFPLKAPLPVSIPIPQDIDGAAELEKLTQWRAR